MSALVPWMYRILLCGCEHSENLTIITIFDIFIGAPTSSMAYIDLPMRARALAYPWRNDVVSCRAVDRRIVMCRRV